MSVGRRVFVAMMGFVLAGCEVELGGPSSDSQPVAANELQFPEARQAAPQPEAPQPADPAPKPAPAPEPEPKPAPAPEPEPKPEPPPPVQAGAFLWEPRDVSVRVVIPAQFAHWQFHVFSRRRHRTLYGPDNRGGNRYQAIEYILPGGGDAWRQRSLNAGDDGTLLVFINTRDAVTPPYKNTGWRIMNPSAVQSGDGDRLKAGENK